LAVNSSGALIGTVPDADCSPLTVIEMFSGPPGLTSAYSVGISILAGPAGRRCALRSLVRWMMNRLYS